MFPFFNCFLFSSIFRFFVIWLINTCYSCLSPHITMMMMLLYTIWFLYKFEKIRCNVRNFVLCKFEKIMCNVHYFGFVHVWENQAQCTKFCFCTSLKIRWSSSHSGLSHPRLIRCSRLPWYVFCICLLTYIINYYIVKKVFKPSFLKKFLKTVFKTDKMCEILYYF